MPVIISKSAQKDIAKLDEKMRGRIFKAIDKLEQGIIKPDRLQGDDKGYKVKVGKYRIVWKYKDGNIKIAKVKLRKIVYRNLINFALNYRKLYGSRDLKIERGVIIPEIDWKKWHGST